MATTEATRPPAAAKSAQDPTAPKKEKKPAPTRGYTIYTRHAGTLEQVIEALKAEHAMDEQVTVISQFYKITGINPKLAMSAVAEFRELEGDYEVAADSSFTSFPGLSTKVKRTVVGL